MDNFLKDLEVSDFQFDEENYLRETAGNSNHESRIPNEEKESVGSF